MGQVPTQLAFNEGQPIQPDPTYKTLVQTQSISNMKVIFELDGISKAAQHKLSSFHIKYTILSTKILYHQIV